MDYDENDFQNHYFQLAGEDHKFSTNLDSLALPKFDGEHPRFDNLAGREGMVGIQGQKNNWIEDYSPGDSAIEFSSNAAESCSSIMQNNVWSEATSSESVEMLFKSVGDGMIVQKSVIMDSLTNDQNMGDHGALSVMKDESHNMTLRNSQCNDSELSQDSYFIIASDLTEHPSSKFKVGKSTFWDSTSSNSGFSSSGRAVNVKHLGGDNFIYREPSDFKIKKDLHMPKEDEATNQHMESISVKRLTFYEQKLDSLDMVSNKCSNSVFSVNSDGLIEVVSCSNYSLNAEMRVCDEVCGKEEHSGSLIKQKSDCKNSSTEINSEAVPKVPDSTEVCKISDCGKYGSIEDDETHMKEYLPRRSSSMSFSEWGKLDTSIDVEEKQEPDNKQIINTNKDVGIIPHLLRELYICPSVSYDTQGTDTIDSHSLGNNGVKEPKIVDVEEKQESNHKQTVNTDKSVGIFHHLLRELYTCTPIGYDTQATNTLEHHSLDSKEGAESKTVIPGLAENLDANSPDIVKLDTLDTVNSYRSSVPDANPYSTPCRPCQYDLGSSNLVELSIICKNAHGFSSGGWQTAEMSSFDDPSSKGLLQEELRCDTVSMSFQKSANLHRPNPNDTSDVVAVGQQNESSTHAVSHATHSVAKHVEMFAVSSMPTKISLTSEEASDLALCSHPDKAEEALTEEISQDCLGISSAFPEKTASSLLSQEIVGEGLSSCLVIPDSVDSKDNGTELCREANRSSPRESVDEKLKGVDAASFCVEDTFLGATVDPHPFTDMEPSQSSDCDQQQNDVSSAIGVTVGNVSPIDLGGEGIVHGCVKDNDNSAFSHESKESALVVSGSEDKFLLLEAHIGSHSSSVQKFVPSTILSCREFPQDDPEKENSSRHCLNQKVPPSEDGGFTFKVPSSDDLPEIGCGCNSKSFSCLQSKENLQMPKEIHLGCPEEGKVLFVVTKTLDETTSRDTPTPSTQKKITSQLMAAKSSCDISSNDVTLRDDILLVHMPEHIFLRSIMDRKSSSLTIHKSSIPDLNSSISSSALFYQPFTDLQQVQLRAQIFVYGALISGTPPDEADMVSSFGGTDGGRSLWENILRAIVDRFLNQKSTIGGYGTPSSSRPASGAPELVSPSNAIQSEAASISAVRNSSIVVSSTLSLSSPLSSMLSGDAYRPNFDITTPSDVNQTSPLLYPYKFSESSQYAGANSLSLSQSPSPSAWSFPSQSSSHPAAIPDSEAIHTVLSIDPCRPLNPFIHATTPTVFISSSSLTTTLTPVFTIETIKKTPKLQANKNTHTPQMAMSKTGTPSEQPSIPTSQPSTETIYVSNVVNDLPVPPAILPFGSNFPTQSSPGAHFPVGRSHNIFPNHYQIRSVNSSELTVIHPEQSRSKIEQAKLQAEESAALATTSVKHCQAIWTRLLSQRNSGLVSEVEEKTASAAVTVAAAASVAKAAAAAANVASEAASQAKLMVDESISSAKLCNVKEDCVNSLFEIEKQLAGLTPVSILKGNDKIHGSSAVLSAAREVVRRRVEEASAATKWAENLDAIMKAAELAAEAVARAGTIISVVDSPFPFTSLGDDGPGNFWRAKYAASSMPSNGSNLYGDEQFSTIDETGRTADGGISSLKESHHPLEGKFLGNLPNIEKGRFSPVTNSSIQKGSLVEIMSDKEGRRGAWSSACVLDVKDNNAYVCYNDLLSHGGHQLKEWVALDNEKGKPPRIRIAHSTITVKYEGTRKRRREILASYIWTVGDHVDAWIHDGWWEGVVTEKTLGDQTKLDVHFPARGDQHIIHVWDLRPSLVWKEGQWMDWSLSRKESLKAHEGDTPKEKRQKLSQNDPCGLDNQLKKVASDENQKPESKSLSLPAEDRTFSLGKHGSSTNPLQIKRNGLQKEGSKVVFGIPKPGKKRKFMEVSKHYICNNPEKVSEGSQSIKFAKYLMPQAGHQSKNSLKVDNKGRQTGESKSKSCIKTERLGNIQTRSQVEKGSSSRALSNGEIVHGFYTNFASSFSSNGSRFAKKNPSETGSFPQNADVTKVPAIERVQLSKKKGAPGSKTELTFKRKPIVSSIVTIRPTKVEEEGPGNSGKSVQDAMEPRRSNRKIQPTSRLLEGLQSSLTGSKISSAPHKSQKCESSSKGNEHG